MSPKLKPRWSRENPAPLPVNNPNSLIGFGIPTRNSRHLFWSEVKEGIIAEYLLRTRNKYVLSRVVYGDNIYHQITLVDNPNLRIEHLERLTLITEEMSHYNGLLGWSYLTDLITYHNIFPTKLLLDLALRHNEVRVLTAIKDHINTSRETKVIAVLKLGTIK